MRRFRIVRDRLQTGVAGLYAVMMVVVLLIFLFFADMHFAREGNCENYLPAWILIPIGLIFVYGAKKLLDRFCEKKDRIIEKPVIRKLTPRSRLLIVSALLFAVQIFAVWNYYFFTDWDVRTIVNTSDAFAHGEDVTQWADYYSMYPNNLFLIWIFAAIRVVGHAVGLHAHEYFLILCVQCLLNTLTGYLFALILNEMFGSKKITVFGYIAYVLLIGASPWVSIPYSDSVGLIFPVWILHLYVRRKHFRYPFVPWLLIGCISYAGYKIKPQVLIALIAIVIISALGWKKPESGAIKSVLLSAGGLTVGIVCAALLVHLAVASIGMPVNEEKNFSLQHYFMMGLGTNQMGAWDGDDVDFSNSFETREERNAADMEEAFSRIRELGFFGVCRQMAAKTLTNYYDGMFCWAGEGSFFCELKERNTCASVFFRGLYYRRSVADIGKYYQAWSNLEQMLWLTILFLSVFSAFIGKSSGRNVVMLAIIGLSVFQLLFEARARYLYIYAPYYIILAMYGVRFFERRFRHF